MLYAIFAVMSQYDKRYSMISFSCSQKQLFVDSKEYSTNLQQIIITQYNHACTRSSLCAPSLFSNRSPCKKLTLSHGNCALKHLRGGGAVAAREKSSTRFVNHESMRRHACTRSSLCVPSLFSNRSPCKKLTLSHGNCALKHLLPNTETREGGRERRE